MIKMDAKQQQQQQNQNWPYKYILLNRTSIVPNQGYNLKDNQNKPVRYLNSCIT